MLENFFSKNKFVKFRLSLNEIACDWHQNCLADSPRTREKYCISRQNRSKPSERSYDDINKKKVKSRIFSKKNRIFDQHFDLSRKNDFSRKTFLESLVVHVC